MAIEAVHCSRTFYALEALNLIVSMGAEFGKHSHDRLLDDIDEFRHTFDAKLASAIFDYSAAVVFGEMRHATSRCTHHNPYVPGAKTSRGESYVMAHNYEPMSILRVGEQLFNKYSWASSFGGKKWGFIANRVQLRGKVSNREFCDICFSLSHNSSPYLDKSEADIFKIYDRDFYVNMLNKKFEAPKPIDLLMYCCTNGLGYNTRALIRRSVVLGFIDEALINYPCNMHEIDKSEEFILDYKSYSWSKEELPMKFINENANYCAYNDDDDSEYINCEDDSNEQEEKEEREERYGEIREEDDRVQLRF